MTLPSHREERGVSTVEYSLIAAAIAALIVLVVFAVGRYTTAAYTHSCDSLSAGDFSVTHTCS